MGFLRSSLFTTLICAAVLALSSCQKKSETEEATSTGGFFSAKNKLVVGTCAEFPPFESYGSDGVIQGIDIDIMDSIAKRLGMEMVVENIDFDLIIDKLAEGTLDVGAACITITEERAKLVDFTGSYYTSYQVLIVPAHSEITGKDSLEGKVIAAQSGSIGESLAKDLGSAAVSFPRASDAVLAVLYNNADAAILDEEPAKRFQAKNSIRIKVLPEKLATDVYAIAVSRKKPKLHEKVSKALDEMVKTGELDDIIDKWMK